MNEFEAQPYGEDDDDSPPEATPLGHAIVLGMGLLTLGLGVSIVLMVTSGAAPEPGSETPSWVILLVGFLFQISGLAIIIQHPFWMLDEMPVLKAAIQIGLAGLLYLVFTLVFGWVAFAAGERTFTTTVSGLGTSSTSTSSEGRGGFAIGTIAIALMGIYHIVSLIRQAIKEQKK